MEVKGNVYIFGNHIEKQVVGTQNNYYGKGEAKPSANNLRSKIDEVIGLMTSGSMWFCIYRGLVDAKLHKSGDYAGFVAMIKSLYPEGVPHGIDAGTIGELDVQSWSKKLEDWTRDDAPRQGKTYAAYEGLTEAFEAVLMMN